MSGREQDKRGGKKGAGGPWKGSCMGRTVNPQCLRAFLGHSNSAQLSVVARKLGFKL
jgi:hypothetical protein